MFRDEVKLRLPLLLAHENQLDVLDQPYRFQCLGEVARIHIETVFDDYGDLVGDAIVCGRYEGGERLSGLVGDYRAYAPGCQVFLESE